MGIEQLKVHEIVKQSVSNNVDIPEFQREFVWDPEQVKLLSESLHRDYPVGSFLLWDYSAYQEAKTVDTNASLWIVDGQQRTTALCLLFGQKPYWWNSAQAWNETLHRFDVLVNVLPEGDSPRLEFSLPNPIRRQDPRWVSLRSVLRIENVEDLTSLAQNIVASAGLEMQAFARVHARIQGLWQIRQREIPTIKISHEVEDVAEIFARLNRAGTRVKEADVILALAAVRNRGWVRKEFLPFRDGLENRGWDLDAGVFIRAIAGIGRGRARLAEISRDFWSPDNLLPAWKDSRLAISAVIKNLAEFGVWGPDLLPSTNSLIPLFVLYHRFSGQSEFQFKKSLHWFLQANRDGRYSGSAITSLNEDVRAITDASSFEEALDSLKKRLRTGPQVSAEEFLGRYDRSGNLFLRLMLYLVLFHQGATDWVDGTRIGYDKTGSPLTVGFAPEWHHIYPQRVLRARSVPLDYIHALANITILNERTNVAKLSSKEPWHYIHDFRITTGALRSHFVPESAMPTGDQEELRRRWDLARYDDFLVERAVLLAGATNRFLCALEGTASCIS